MMEGLNQSISAENKATVAKIEQEALERRLQKLKIEYADAKASGDPKKLEEVLEQMRVANITPPEDEKIEVKM